MNSSYQQQPEVDPENSEKGGWDTCPLASYIETFYCSEYSDKNNTKIIISRKRGPLWPAPLNPPLLLLNVTAPLLLRRS